MNEESTPEIEATCRLNAVPADVDDVPGLRQSAYAYPVVLIILLHELNCSRVFIKVRVKLFLVIFRVLGSIHLGLHLKHI